MTKKALWYLSPTAISGLLGIVSIPIMTAYLSVQQFGLMELFLIVLIACKYLFGFGWDSSLIRFYNDTNENKYAVASSTFTFRLIVHLLIFVMFYFFSENFANMLKIDNNYLDLLWLVLFIYILEDYVQFLVLLFRSENMAKSYGLLKINQSVIRFVLLVLFFVVLDLDIYAVFYSLFLVNIAIVAFALIKYRKYIDIKQELHLSSDMKKSFTFGFPLIFAALAFFIINFSDRYMLNFLLEKEIALQEIGLYAFYTKIATALLMFSIVFKMIWSPMVFKYYQYPNYKKIFNYMMNFFVIVSLGVSLFASLYSFEILSLFSMNEEYLLKYNALALVFIMQLLILIGDYAPIGIGIMKKNVYRALFGILFAAVNIVLNYFLIPLYMLEGAMMASIFSMLGYVVAINIVSYRLYKVKFNYFIFLIGLVALSSMYLVSTIDLLYRVVVLLGLFLVFSIYIKTNFIKYKVCFLTLKKNKIL